MATNYNDRAVEILQECADLLSTKNEDYANGLVTDDMYFFPGIEAAPNAVLIYTKFLRYLSTYTQEGEGNHDKVDDCLRDLINYSARALARIEDEAKTK